MHRKMTVKYKKCSRCCKVLSLDCFSVDNSSKDKLTSACKACQKKWREDNAEKLSKYRRNNSAELNLRCKRYREANPEKKKIRDKKYYDSHKEEARLQFKRYYKKNRKKILKIRKAPAMYEQYAKQIGYAETIRKGPKGYLVCLCVYCGREFIPNNTDVMHRIGSLNGSNEGEAKLYCSDKCKRECPTYWRNLTAKSTKSGTSREVPATFRQIALRDRNYTCEKCGSTENGLHVHHIEGATEQPLLSADLKNVLVVCKSCHKKIHKQKGCGYYDYRCNVA